MAYQHSPTETSIIEYTPTDASRAVPTVRLLARDELRACEAIAQQVFRFSDRELTPAREMYVSSTRGGFVFGAWIDRKLVGYSYSVPAFDGEGPYLFSNGLAVLQEYRSCGIGLALKQTQRAHALRRGYTVMRWTVDSLAAQPLYLYLTKLGAEVTACHPDHLDSLSDKDSSDELEIEWRLRPYIESPPRQVGIGDVGARLVWLETVSDGPRVVASSSQPPTTEMTASVELPWSVHDLRESDRLCAEEWRLKARLAIETLLESGFRGVAVARDAHERRSYLAFRTLSQ